SASPNMTDDLEIAPASADKPRYLAPGDVGLVTPREFVYNQAFTFKSGQVIPGFTLRYETYGTLNATRSNAILVCHALSGDHHCAGWHKPEDRKPGWWNNLRSEEHTSELQSRENLVCRLIL